MSLVTPPPDRIYLLRHAKSGWALPGQRDFDRSLDDAGYAEAELVADAASEKNYRPDLLISSTAVRCRQTADAIQRAFPGEMECRFVDDLYNAPADNYLEILSALQGYGSVMLVGHNPAIEEVLISLAGMDAANRAIPEGYPTAGLTVLDHHTPAVAGEKPWLLTDFLVG
ncbi:MAG: phosphohistidine phosphatase [Shinella sp.]|nr:MAG: phosphohistidine phosphatase [Shinella sp.]